ncbi:MAG: hypothetical protein HKN16_11250, partial [Saprospiraceae bacterium]|nr:hypothetical protein [Saprospiraceae bacterium]
ALAGNVSFIYTADLSKHIDLSLIGHGTAIMDAGGVRLYPGVNMNLGISPGDESFIIRPEIGFNFDTATAGIGMEIKIAGTENTRTSLRKN